jgi:hemerythrin-like domain-containing protein
MKPTEILSAEHRVIEEVLDCVEKIAQEAMLRRVLDVDAASKALRVLKTFADTCHHGKEERLLFPKMQSRGLPAGVGPIAMMLDEHDTGRAHLRGMDAAIRTLSGGDRNSLRIFAEHAIEYVELMREHIAKEDNILFPMAEAVFSDFDRRDLCDAFDHAEHAELGDGTHETMLALADELAERFGVPKAEQRSPAAFTGCCHHAKADAHCAH